MDPFLKVSRGSQPQLWASTFYDRDMELTRRVEVGEGGRIDFVAPELQQGETVEVRVTKPSKGKREPNRALKGLKRMADDFADLLPDFQPYR